MPIFNGWIIRALAARLRQPGMRPQRRFLAAASLLMALFVTGAVIYLFRQPTEDAMERAALKVFAAMGGSTQAGFVLTGMGAAEQVSGLATTASLNDVFLASVDARERDEVEAATSTPESVAV